MKLQAYKKWGFTVTNYKEYKKYMKCTHETYNELCAICHDIEAQAGYAVKEGLADLDTWEDKLEYYNRPEPMEDEPSEDDYADRITDNEIQDRLEADIINMVNEEKV